MELGKSGNLAMPLRWRMEVAAKTNHRVLEASVILSTEHVRSASSIEQKNCHFLRSDFK